MTPERWQQIKAVLGQAMELPADERAAFVVMAAGDDAELRREVESLLASADGPESLPAARAAIATTAEQTILENALGQQYEIIRPLGRGGMGAVYLARERSLERFVAIKVLRPDLADAPDARERFRREARIAAQLSHPGILPLYTFGEVAGLWYFVTAYVRGVSLAERLRVEGRLPQEEAAGILIELADALECAHRHGVIHRDIKPGNVLLDAETGHALLADFGVSKMQGLGDALTITGMVVGTPNYMSPEQAVGAPDLDERSDLYSLGAVGYTMLAGREPFAGVQGADLVQWRMSHDPDALERVAPHVPKELAHVVMRALAREKTARWSSAEAMRGALVRATSAGDAVLPEPLRGVATFGPYALIWAIGWTVLAARKLRDPTDRLLLMLVALVVPLGFALHIMNAGRHGLRASELARIAFWPPEWWGMWWPRSLRRPNDLWSRLPLPARIARVALSLLLVALPGIIVFRPLFDERSMTFSIIGMELALVLGTAAVLAACLAWGVMRGLGAADAARMLFGATTASQDWSDPQIARMLTPARGGVRPPDRDSAADHLRAIDELTRDSGALGADVARVARKLATAIDTADRAVAAVSQLANTIEIDRLSAQLATLEATEHGELQDLVRRQLEVVRAMRDRVEASSQRRGQLLTFLRGLYTQVREVHAGASDVRLRALIAEIGALPEIEVGA